MKEPKGELYPNPLSMPCVWGRTAKGKNQNKTKAPNLAFSSFAYMKL